MAGGPSTVALAAAVASGGGFPFLAGGYKTPDALHAEMTALAADTDAFGVNLFAPGDAAVDPAAFAAYAREIGPEAASYGGELDPVPRLDDDRWEEKLALLEAHPVPVVSFTFALPDAAVIRRLQHVGSQVLITVTSPSEALAAASAGADALVVQGAAAGGHSGTFDPGRSIPDTPTAALVRRVCAVTRLPVIAAGGVDGPETVAELRAAGAAGVAAGTMFLLAVEAGTANVHRTALMAGDISKTVRTRAFTGRPARALRNAFAMRHTASAPVAYPAVHHLTRELRARAAQAGDRDTTHLWAGTGWRAARERPAVEIVRWLSGS